MSDIEHMLKAVDMKACRYIITERGRCQMTKNSIAYCGGRTLKYESLVHMSFNSSGPKKLPLLAWERGSTYITAKLASIAPIKIKD